MPNVQVIDRKRHTGKRWQRYTSYLHTAADAVAHLVMPELPRACVAMPIGFVEVKGGLAPVAIQGLEPGRNEFVAADGRWLADYVPAAYRSYPFVLGTTESGRPVLCMIEGSGLVSDTRGEPFFGEQGEPAPVMTQILDFLIQMAGQRRVTQRVCKVLREYGLFQPWPFTRSTEAGEETILGLHRIDTAALGRLPPEAFEEIRRAGALPMIYCHLLSMQHLAKLKRLSQDRAATQGGGPSAVSGELDLEFLNHDGTVGFGALNPPLMQSREVRP